jgi:hypothetical protein
MIVEFIPEARRLDHLAKADSHRPCGQANPEALEPGSVLHSPTKMESGFNIELKAFPIDGRLLCRRIPTTATESTP